MSQNINIGIVKMITIDEDKNFDLFDFIIKIMEHAETMHGYTGEKKKLYVMQLIKMYMVDKWGEEYFNKYEYIIPLIIEFIITISKNEIIININKKIKKHCGCLPRF